MKTAVVGALLASFVGTAPALAQPYGRARRHYKHQENREAREEYWDTAKHYRKDEQRYHQRHLGKNDRGCGCGSRRDRRQGAYSRGVIVSPPRSVALRAS